MLGLGTAGYGTSEGIAPVGRDQVFGKLENPKNMKLQDLNVREFATFVPLIILALAVVSIFGKTWDLHVKRALGITLPENFNAPYLKPNLTQFWNSVCRIM